ncbi:aminoglycoside phosphotransferase family protein [Streptomyces yerevanensis]|uniref:phosphotransferase n=1 Tax=Streptomyces yerevanensis TaxID=66378 RepID=UPI000AEBE67F|nr:aminoglycoside phosphotransferase family protein [Streptomyces yerevanensis]
MTSRGPFAQHRLHRTVQLACRHAGLPQTDEPELIHVTMNALFKIPGVPVIVRIAPSASLLADTERLVQVARWLDAVGFPAVRLLPEIPQPLLIDETDYIVTFWLYLPQDARPTPRAYELAGPLRQLHALRTPEFDLPRWEPIREMRERLADSSTLSPDDRAWLGDSVHQFDEQLGDLTYPLPHRGGVTHGDAYIGNLLHGPHGEPVLCDLDSLCRGPAEWDLVPELVACIRYQRPIADYDLLCQYHGADIRTWSGRPVLRRLRELKVLTAVLPVLDSSPGLAEQVCLRLRGLREGAEVPWTPFRMTH